MLISKSQELIDLCQQKETQQRIADNLQAFQSRQKQITDALTMIEPIVEAVRAFRQRELANFDVVPKVDSLVAIIAEAEEKFRQNPEWIIENNNFKANSFISSIRGLKNTIEQQLSQAWNIYLKQRMPSTNNEMLNVLSKVEAFKYTVQEIRIFDKEIKDINFPKNNVEFEKYERKIEQLKLCWNSLNSDEVPDTVLRLLKDAANQGASLSLLTPEVQDWINKHNISDSLKIRLI